MDGDDIPSRHRKKKRKSNSKSTEMVAPIIETSKQFSKRELTNNWKKYDDKTTSKDVADVPTPSNFEELLLAPASIGGHFQFSSEKSWEGSDDWYNRDDYFQLNLLELSNSLATIPFYERQGYTKDIFSSEEIEDMNRQAKFQYFKWSDKTKNKVRKDSPVDEKCELNETQATVNVPQNDEDDLDELLSLPGTRQQTIQSADIPSITSTINKVTIPLNRISQASTATADDSTDDIQKWLDDVLILDS